jgi:hypothetical protein
MPDPTRFQETCRALLDQAVEAVEADEFVATVVGFIDGDPTPPYPIDDFTDDDLDEAGDLAEFGDPVADLRGADEEWLIDAAVREHVEHWNAYLVATFTTAGDWGDEQREVRVEGAWEDRVIGMCRREVDGEWSPPQRLDERPANLLRPAMVVVNGSAILARFVALADAAVDGCTGGSPDVEALGLHDLVAPSAVRWPEHLVPSPVALFVTGRRPKDRPRRHPEPRCTRTLN